MSNIYRSRTLWELGLCHCHGGQKDSLWASNSIQQSKIYLSLPAFKYWLKYQHRGPDWKCGCQHNSRSIELYQTLLVAASNMWVLSALHACLGNWSGCLLVNSLPCCGFTCRWNCPSAHMGQFIAAVFWWIHCHGQERPRAIVTLPHGGGTASCISAQPAPHQPQPAWLTQCEPPRDWSRPPFESASCSTDVNRRPLRKRRRRHSAECNPGVVSSCSSTSGGFSPSRGCGCVLDPTTCDAPGVTQSTSHSMC